VSSVPPARRVDEFAGFETDWLTVGALLEYVLHKLSGYGKAPRLPLLPLRDDEGLAFLASLQELLETEAELRMAAK
jgi:hypothetical protein